MFYRTKVEKSGVGLKDRNNENINKKKKKNKNISPTNITDRQYKHKQDYGLVQKKTERTQRSQEKSKEKILNKILINQKQPNKSKKTLKKLNNSPIKQQKKNSNPSQKQNSHSRSKDKSPSTSRKNTGKAKLYDSQPLQATKKQLFDNTQKSKSKSPIPKAKSKQKKANHNKHQIQQTNKQAKRQNCYSTPLKTQPIENTIVHPLSEQIQFQQYLSPKGKVKKSIRQIRTQFSGRKKSYIDQQLLHKLENHNKSNKKIDYIESCLLRSIQKEEDQSNTKSNRINRSKDESIAVLSFKRQQEQKWYWMLEQIKSLKNQHHIQNKIDLLINQITQNYRTLQKKVKVSPQLTIQQPQKLPPMEQVIIQNNQTYSNISIGDNNSSKLDQIQVRIEYKNPQKQSSRSHMISLQDFFNFADKNLDKNLKRQLFQNSLKQPLKDQIKRQQDQIVQIKEESNNQVIVGQQVEQNSQQYLEQLINKQKSIQAKPQQPKEQEPIHSQIQLSNMIENILINEFCQTLLRNKKLLHYFLIHFDQPIPNNDPPQFSHYQQPSSNDYTLQIVNKLLNYLFTHYKQYLFTQMSYYYQCKPLQILRYVRSNFEQEQEQLNYQLQNQTQIQIPFFNLDKIYQFQTQILKNQNYSPQNLNLNYFNQCIYDTFNDIIDNLRPYGSKGKPIFTKQLSHPLKTQSSIRNKITNKFKYIFENEWQQQFINDNLIHGQQGNFQIIYFLSLEITDIIYNECTVEINKIIRRRNLTL